VLRQCDGGRAAANGNHDRQRTTEITALQNALNNNIYSTTSAPPQSIDHLLDAVKIRCSTSTGSSVSSSTSSASNGVKLPLKCERYKTELCRTYEENGTCRYGDKCQFAHGAAELRTVVRHPKYKTDLCRTFHTIGFCPYGSRCHFIHSLHERQLPPQPSRMHVPALNLLLSQLAVKSTRLPSAPVITEKQSLDNLLQALSTLLQTSQRGADPIATSLLAQAQARNLAVRPSNAEFLMHGAYVSDATSISADSASPCPSPTSLNGAFDDPSSRSYFAMNSGAHIPQSTNFQSPDMAPPGILSPPSSPGSAASSLNSVGSDCDSYDATWSRSVWPALMSPVNRVDISLVPDFAQAAQQQLLNRKQSTVFA